MLVVTGNPETKELKDMLPDALKQLGPHQLNHIKNLLGAGGVDAVKESSKQEEDDDDVPDLVGTNFEEASKKE